MAKFQDIVEVKDRPWNRAMRVFIDAPSLDGLDVSTLAQRAQLSPSKKITHGAVTVKVEPFGR